MAPSSREAIGPKILDESPFSAPSPRGTVVQKSPMHAYSLVSLGVGWCATNETVQFFVCCGTFDLSVGVFFFNVELVFLRPCLFRRLVRNFSFLLLFRRLKLEHTSPGVRVGIRMGVRVCGRMGVGVWVFFSVLPLPTCRPRVPACPPRVPACLACLGAGRPCLLGCPPASEVSTTRGTVKLAFVTARHDRIHSQTFQYFWDFLRIRHVPWTTHSIKGDSTSRQTS